MRIKLKKGKQKELILKAKGTETWKQLADRLNINQKYLYYDLRNEIRLLSNEIYEKLCSLIKINYDGYIIKKLNTHWGQSKGGLNSKGTTKQLPDISLDENLAEFIGAVLGDGHICFYKQKRENRFIGTYSIKIAGDLKKDEKYHYYLRELVKNTFSLNAKIILRKNERFLDIVSKELVNFFINMGLKPGNKIKNQSTIPRWIFNENTFLKSCLRGLIDTDGCIHKMSKRDSKLLRINFTNHNLTLLKDTRKIFLKLGFHPSKIILNRVFYISRQNEIKKYLKEIGFKNDKHLKRLRKFSPVV